MRVTPGQWQVLRRRFNHDWMQNRYLPWLATYLNLLEDRQHYQEYTADFDRLVLEEWRQHSDDADALLESFFREMAPSFLFAGGPLRVGGTGYSWVASVADALWRARLRAPTLLDDARRALVQAKKRFSFLAAACDDGVLPEDGERRTRVAEELRSFRDCCEQLGGAVSALPELIRVT